MSYGFANIYCSTRFDYDRWASYGGDQWKADNVLPIFAELEGNTLINVDNMTEFLKYPLTLLNCLSIGLTRQHITAHLAQ